MAGKQAPGAGRIDVDESGESDSRALVRRQLGGAIRRRRHAASLTLATVSERAGISVSMLSQVERGLLDPSLDTLRNIAEALGTAPFRLLAEEGPVAGVVRRGDRRRAASTTAATCGASCSRRPREGAFEIAVWELEPGRSKPGAPRAHPGEEANLLLRGRARLEIDDELIDLAAGDCVTFDPRRPHRMTALGDEPLVCVDVDLPARALTRAAARRLAFGRPRLRSCAASWIAFQCAVKMSARRESRHASSTSGRAGREQAQVGIGAARR